MKKAIKYISYFLLTIVALVICLIIFIQTGFGKNFILETALSNVNNMLNAELVIDELNGNLFSEIELNNIILLTNKDTTAIINKIYIEYDLLKLLQDSLIIKTVVIDTSNFILYESKDKGWNYLNIAKIDTAKIKEGKEDKPDKSNNDGGFPFAIKVDSLKLINLSTSYLPIKPIQAIPQQINNFNLLASGEFSDGNIKAEISSLTLETVSPDLLIKKLNTKAELFSDNVIIKNFDLFTSKNHFILSGNYNLSGKDSSIILFNANDIDLSEFNKFVTIPEIDFSPTLSLEGFYINDNLEFNISISETPQEISLKGKIANLNKRPNYNTEINVDAIDIGKFLNDKSVSSSISGNFIASGSGFDIHESQFSVDSKLNKSEILDYTLNSMELSANKFSDSIKFLLGVDTEVGKIKFEGLIVSPIKNPKYNFEYMITNLDLEKAINNQQLKSDLNGKGKISGRSFDIDKLNSEIEFDLSNSTFSNHKIDQIYGLLDFSDYTVAIDSLHISIDSILTDISGDVSLKSASNINLKSRINSLDMVENTLEIYDLKGSGNIEANVSGKIDSLNSNIIFSFENLSYLNNSIEQINGTIEFAKLDSNITTELKSIVENTNLSNMNVDSVIIKSKLDNNHITNNLSFSFYDSIFVELNPKVIIDSNLIITIPNFQINYFSNIWSNKKEIEFEITENEKIIKNFNLAADSQSVFVSANVIDTVLNNAEIVISNFNVNRNLNRILNTDFLDATLNIDMNLNGLLSKPNINGTIKLNEIILDNYSLGNLHSSINMDSSNIKWKVNIEDTSKYMLDAFGFVEYDFDNPNFVVANAPFNITLNTSEIDLKNIKVLKWNDFIIDGKFKSDFSISNTPLNPKVVGNLTLKDGSLSSEFYGTNFSAINFNLIGDSNNFKIENFLIEEPGGSLELSGFISTNLSDQKKLLEPSEIKLTANQFDVVNSERYNLQIDGNLNLKKENSEAYFDGYITVPKAKFYVPSALSQTSGKSINENTPILIKEINKDRIKNDTINISYQLPDTAKINWAKFISGKFALDIPGNFWLRGPNINMEIFGKIDVEKHGENLAFIGQIKINRGFYTIFGKKFVVKEGTIEFDGNPEFNPEILLEVEYSFRDNYKQERYLTLRVTNRMLQPEIQFAIDDEPISEGDAVSYILFGKKMEELTQSQQKGVSSGEIATNIAANLLASQISNTFGSTLSLDVIEITGEDNWARASFTAGKYITNDIFVQYERGFGKDDDGTVDPQIFTLEYQITRLFYLHLIEATNKTSGIDFIIKFD